MITEMLPAVDFAAAHDASASVARRERTRMLTVRACFTVSTGLCCMYVRRERRQETESRGTPSPSPRAGDEQFRPASPASVGPASESVYIHAIAKACLLQTAGHVCCAVWKACSRAGRDPKRSERFGEPMPQIGRSFSKGWTQLDVHVHVQLQTASLASLVSSKSP